MFLISPFLRGGLGNQLFQIGAALGYVEKHPNYKVILDLKKWTTKPISHHTPYLYFDRFIHGIEQANCPNPSLSKEIEGVFNPIKEYDGNIVLWGYFQSALYLPSRQTLLEHFHLTEFDQAYLSQKYQGLLSMSNTVSVHIRRTDYIKFLGPDEQARVEKFIRRAIEQAQKDIHEPVFVFFTDDKEYVRKILPFDAIMINEELDYFDFWLMSQCHHHIVPISTFSWWAMYLSPHTDGYNYVIQPWLKCFNGSNDIYAGLDFLSRLRLI